MALDDLFSKLRRWTRPWETGDSSLELRRAVLDDVERRAVAVGGGRRIFPFDRVKVRLLAPPGEGAVLESVAREGWDLAGEVRERLRERGVEPPSGLEVAVHVVEEGPGGEAEEGFGERRFQVLYGKSEEGAGGAGGARRAGGEGRPVLELTVLKGKAARQVYTPQAERVLLGRLAEVLDADGRVKRRNDVAFLDEGEINETVSREHARIAWDEATGGYWLRDEQSAYGTRIFREGRSIEVSGSDRRGVRLRAGDEVYLGRACLKVNLREAD
jgi:hypothetical protein